jgi:hypothetical protein
MFAQPQLWKSQANAWIAHCNTILIFLWTWGITFRLFEPHKSSCPPCSFIAYTLSVESLSSSNQWTSAGCSSSGVGGSVVKPLRQLSRHAENGMFMHPSSILYSAFPNTYSFLSKLLLFINMHPCDCLSVINLSFILTGWQESLSKLQDRVRIFFAVLFWMSLFFWGSAWDGPNNSGGKKRQWFRKKQKWRCSRNAYFPVVFPHT